MLLSLLHFYWMFSLVNKRLSIALAETRHNKRACFSSGLTKILTVSGEKKMIVVYLRRIVHFRALCL